MTTVTTEATIARPIEAVFDYVTTPRHWLVWHPSSLDVSGTTERSLLVGDEVSETFRVAGRKGRVVWRTVLRDAPIRFAIAGRVAGGGDGTITYTFTPAGDTTAFRREFVYAMPNAFAALLDWLFLRRRIEAESAEAVRRLKRALETQ